MIDQELIAQQTFSIQSSIKSRVSTPITGLWQCRDVLTATAIDKLKDYIHTADDSVWQTVDRQENLARRKIAWHADTVIEELHSAFDANTDLVNLLWPERKKRFLGLQLWKDWQGYELAWHVDNDLIDISMQIYLFDLDPGLGTTFRTQQTTVDVPYQHNTGYLAENSADLFHRTTRTTPPNTTRYSLYAVWSHTR